MGVNPSYFSETGGGRDRVKGQDTRRFPVEYVSWQDAVEFCRRLADLPEEKRAGHQYRLPTEAEWEYSCRGGASSVTPFYFETPSTSASSLQANFEGNYPYGGAPTGPYLKRTTTVGSYKPNAFGLYDMHGNVWEWCRDWYGEYPGEKVSDPFGPAQGSSRVFRGGCWDSYGSFCRAALRSRNPPVYQISGLGFRLAGVPSGK
jgi:formylglycine-generating enzyme required for sulfatase activity